MPHGDSGLCPKTGEIFFPIKLAPSSPNLCRVDACLDKGSVKRIQRIIVVLSEVPTPLFQSLQEPQTGIYQTCERFREGYVKLYNEQS